MRRIPPTERNVNAGYNIIAVAGKKKNQDIDNLSFKVLLPIFHIHSQHRTRKSVVLVQEKPFIYWLTAPNLTIPNVHSMEHSKL